MAKTSALLQDSILEDDNTTQQKNIDLILERETLLAALSHIQSVVERKNTIPILANVKLDGKDNKLFLTTTDMEVAITEQINAITNNDLLLTVPAHMFFEIIRKMPNGAKIELSIDQDNNGRLNVRSGNANFALPFLPAENFPVIEYNKPEHNFRISASELSALINKTKFAVCNDIDRYSLNGIYFHVKGSSLLSVATDGHRLAKMEITLPDGAQNIPGVILPKKTAHELSRLLSGFEGEVEVSISRTKIHFSFGNIVFISKLIEGGYPGYESVIPEMDKNIMEVSLSELIEAVDRVSTVCTENSRSIRFSVSNSANNNLPNISSFSGVLELDAANENKGSGVEILGADYEGTNIDLRFNSKYMIEILSLIEGGSVQIVFSGDEGATVVLDPVNRGAIYVIMPIIASE